MIVNGFLVLITIDIAQITLTHKYVKDFKREKKSYLMIDLKMIRQAIFPCSNKAAVNVPIDHYTAVSPKI